MTLKAPEGFIFRNRHTGEKRKVISVPNGWEDVYEQVEIDSEVPENSVTENKSISDRLSTIETFINKIKKILPISETGDDR